MHRTCMTRRTAMILAAWAHGLLMSALTTGCANHATQVQIRNDTQLTLDVAVLVMTLIQWHSFLLHLTGRRTWRGRTA